MLFNKLSACIAIVGFASLTLSEAAYTKRDTLAGCSSNNPRSEQIKNSFLLAYNGYRKHAFGHDELLPVSQSFSDSRYAFF
jgi:mannosyl-oligosaccharide alpha-1,2-mannosidase